MHLNAPMTDWTPATPGWYRCGHCGGQGYLTKYFHKRGEECYEKCREEPCLCAYSGLLKVPTDRGKSIVVVGGSAFIRGSWGAYAAETRLKVP